MSEIKYTWDADERGQELLNVARLKKTSVWYADIFDQIARGRARIPKDELKEALQEYYDLKRQENIAEFDKAVPDFYEIKNVWDGEQLAQLTNDVDTKRMAYTLGNNLVQMAEKARKEFLKIQSQEKEAQNAELMPQKEQTDAQTHQSQPQTEQDVTVATERGVVRNEDVRLKMRLAKLKMLFMDPSRDFGKMSQKSTVQDNANAVLTHFESEGR